MTEEKGVAVLPFVPSDKLSNSQNKYSLSRILFLSFHSPHLGSGSLAEFGAASKPYKHRASIGSDDTYL